MHQYTADLAAQMVRAGCDVHLVTTSSLARDRYAPATHIHTPVATRSTGFGRNGLQPAALLAVERTLTTLQPDVVHFTGVHAWNPLLLTRLRRQGIPTAHTLHDLDPHAGVRFARLIRLWNRWVLAQADHVLVHGQIYRTRLVAGGLPATQVTCAPLLHSFLDHAADAELQRAAPDPHAEPWVLFFGRLEPYKGLEHLLTAAELLGQRRMPAPFLVVAGGGALGAAWPRPLPPGVVLLNRHLHDELGADLFRRCAALVLPYTSATQSALPAAAYAFGKPVVASRSGALAETVQDGVTGWTVAPGAPTEVAECLAAALAAPGEAAARGQAGRRWYEEQRRRQPGELLALYTQVAGAVSPQSWASALSPESTLGPGAS
jgi:glycosyltransferase involved in cell wall biosynthesis